MNLRRRIGAMLAGASFAFAIVSVVLAVWTRFATVEFRGWLGDRTRIEAAFVDGAIGAAFDRTAVRPPMNDYGWDVRTSTSAGRAIYRLNPTVFGWLGFACQRLVLPPPVRVVPSATSGPIILPPAPPLGSVWLVAVPFWLLGVLGLVWPAVWGRKFRQRRRRISRGLCLACGYDLRSSPGRCPECGRTVAPLTQPVPPA